LDYYEELMAQSNPEDEYFMRRVAKTQLFCHFLERFYKSREEIN